VQKIIFTTCKYLYKKCRRLADKMFTLATFHT